MEKTFRFIASDRRGNMAGHITCVSFHWPIMASVGWIWLGSVQFRMIRFDNEWLLSVRIGSIISGRMYVNGLIMLLCSLMFNVLSSQFLPPVELMGGHKRVLY